MDNKTKGLIAAGTVGIAMVVTGIVMLKKKQPAPPPPVNYSLDIGPISILSYNGKSLVQVTRNGAVVGVGLAQPEKISQSSYPTVYNEIKSLGIFVNELPNPYIGPNSIFYLPFYITHLAADGSNDGAMLSGYRGYLSLANMQAGTQYNVTSFGIWALPGWPAKGIYDLNINVQLWHSIMGYDIVDMDYGAVRLYNTLEIT